MTLNPKIGVLLSFFNLWLRCSFQEWIATKAIEIDQDNVRIGTAKAVAHLMSFAHITCSSYNRCSRACF